MPFMIQVTILYFMDFVFLIKVDVRASLGVPRLIPRALKLTIM